MKKISEGTSSEMKLLLTFPSDRLKPALNCMAGVPIRSV